MVSTIFRRDYNLRTCRGSSGLMVITIGSVEEMWKRKVNPSICHTLFALLYFTVVYWTCSKALMAPALMTLGYSAISISSSSSPQLVCLIFAPQRKILPSEKHRFQYVGQNHHRYNAAYNEGNCYHLLCGCCRKWRRVWCLQYVTTPADRRVRSHDLLRLINKRQLRSRRNGTSRGIRSHISVHQRGNCWYIRWTKQGESYADMNLKKMLMMTIDQLVPSRFPAWTHVPNSNWTWSYV